MTELTEELSRKALVMQLWTFAGFGVLIAITVRLWAAMAARTRHADDLGFVSEQWLAEHRHNESHTERR